MGYGIFPQRCTPKTVPVIPVETLNDNSWAVIRKMTDSGQAPSLWSVGDSKKIIINGKVGNTTFSNLEVDVFIIGFNHNESLEGTTRTHFQIGKINGTNIAFVDNNYNNTTNSAGAFTMNTANSNLGGWESCGMRINILGSDSSPTSPRVNTLLAALPADLREVMKPVTKYTDNVGNESRLSSVECCTATIDYLPLLAEYEYFGQRTHAYGNEQSYQLQYDYYKTNGAIKYKYNSTANGTIHYTRSARTNDRYMFAIVNDAGYVNIAYADYSEGISPMFVV